MTFRPLDEVPVDPGRARVYAEGWQSWSPTAPFAAAGAGPSPAEAWQHTMRFRPGSDLPSTGFQAEGLLVVDPGNGDAVRAWGARDAATDVPSLRATLLGDRLLVSADGEVVPSTGEDLAAALGAFGAGFAARAGVGPLRTPPRVWCSWYQYFEDLAASDVLDNVRAVGDHGLPVEVIQIDDGWSRGIGEWSEPTPEFGPLAPVVDEIRAAGLGVGIWLAPFLVGTDTALARRHPEWLLGDAGRNWGQDLVALDLTHPGVREYLHTTVSGLRDAGVDYLKLDFLYAGAVPGRRHGDLTPVEAYRSGLELIREAAGEDTYLLGCGAPILPSVGLVDAMRVSPDTFHEGGEDGSRGLRGRMSLAARAWQHGRFWVNDPDCLVARPSYALREEWARTVESFGGMHTVSDRVADLDEWGLATTRRLLEDVPAPVPFADDVVRDGLETAHAESRRTP